MDHTAGYGDKLVAYLIMGSFLRLFSCGHLPVYDEEEDLIRRIAIITIMIRITVCAKGRVQGVGYRYFVTDCAQESGVSGFVKNMPDGSVLIVAEGRQDVLDRFVSMVRAQSDPVIRVDSLEIRRCEPTGEFSGFGIRL